MEMKSLVSIDIQKNDKLFSFHMPSGCAIGEAYDAAFQVLKVILANAQKTADQAAAQEPA